MTTVDPLFGDAVSSNPTPQSEPSSGNQDPTPNQQDFAGTTHSGLPLQLPTDADLDKMVADTRSGTASITQRLLETHKTSDAGDMGKGINELMIAAKGLNPKDQHHSLIGGLIAKVKGEKEEILAHTQSVQKRINDLSASLDQTANLMRTRIVDLEGLKKENLVHQEKLRSGVANAQQWSQQVAQQLSPPATNPNDVNEATQRKALQHLQQRLQATTADLQNAIVLDQQQAQELQATQDNARAILDEFDRVKNVAIPALTSLVAQQLIALEQKQAMATDAAIREMTNSAITQAAQTLGENEVAISTMQNQSVISVDTLTQAQDILDQADKKVQEIQAQAEIKRREDAAKRADLEKRLIGSTA